MIRKSIAQEDGMGCGVACTAFLLGKTYKQTLRLFHNGEKKADTIGFLTKEIADVLGNDYVAGFAKRNKSRLHVSSSIVFLKRGKKYKYGHYIVRWNKKWMDPWINFPKLQAKSGFRKRLPGKPAFVIFKRV